MSVNPWYFNIATDKLSRLEEAAAAYKAEFERIHSLIDQVEWGQIVAPMNLQSHGLERFLTRPPNATTGIWWESTDPDCWEVPRNTYLDYDISNEMEEISRLLVNGRSRDVRQTTENPVEATFVSSYEPEINDIIDSFATGGWKNNTYFEIAQVVAFFAMPPDGTDPTPSITKISGGEDGELVTAFKKAEAKLTPRIWPNLRHFKSEYEKAIIELAQKEIKQQIAEELEKDPGSIRDGTKITGVGGLDPTGTRTKLGRKIKAEIRSKFEETIEQEVKEELEEAFADNIAYSQQCILLSFMEDLVDSKKARDRAFGKRFLPYSGASKPTNSPLRMLGEPFGFVNRLVVDPSQKEFFKIKNSTLSSLVPHIRFYKVESDDKGRDVETEITFDSNGGDSVFQNFKNKNGKISKVYRKQRGHGVGMKSFNFSYDGTDPFSAKKMIAAKLSIYAATFDELLRERQDPTGKSFKYAELALKTGGVGIDGNKKSLSDIQRENLEKLNFRLKATLGWSLPDSKSFSKLSDDLKDAIYDSFITIYLTPTIHNFSFDETGATIFDIEYLAYIEDAFAQSTYNIFSSLTKEKESREVIFNYFEELGCDIENNNNEQFKKFRKADESIISQINGSAFQEIMGSLQRKERVYYLNFNKQDTEKLNRNPADSNVKFPKPVSDIIRNINYATIIEKATETAADNNSSVDADEALLSIVAASQENNSIPYFYFGDLVDVVMELIELDLARSAQDITSSKYYKDIFKNGGISKFDKFKIEKKIIGQKTKKLRNHLEQFRKMRVILGPMEMFTPLKTDGTILCSIADIPISTSYFFDFMSDRVLSKDIISYPFSKFIKDIINDLIANFLNSDGCTRVDNSQKIKLNSTTICAYNQNRFGSVGGAAGTCLDDITHAIILDKKYVKGEPPLVLSGKRKVDSTLLGIDRMMSYFVFTVGRRSPISNYVGNKTKDESVGIFHYMIGKNNGFVKNITLEKSTVTGLKEVRFEQEGYNGLEQLREVYNAKIETFLNVQTFPGVYVYVEPGGFAPNTTQDLTRFGIGGYCMVTKTEHSIAPGVADTTLHAVWVASKEGDKSKNDKNRSSDKPVVRQPEGKEKIKKCLVGPHYIGLLATGRGKYSGLNAKQRGDLGSEVIESGAYTMVGWDDGEDNG